MKNVKSVEEASVLKHSGNWQDAYEMTQEPRIIRNILNLFHIQVRVEDGYVQDVTSTDTTWSLRYSREIGKESEILFIRLYLGLIFISSEARP